MVDDLLATKLFLPTLKSAFVQRPRLIEQINQGLQAGCGLTLVSAPAGFGKTSLIVDWIAQYFNQGRGDMKSDGSCTSWFALDEGDNDPIRFLAYFITALQKFDESIGDTAAFMLQAPQPPPVEPVLISLLNDIVAAEGNGRAERPHVLVLDDYHLIRSQAIHNAVTFFLDNLPPGQHLILITRSDPPLPLSRYRVRGQMSEIRQADLQFTAAETATFLNDVMGLSLSASQVEKLESRTEGWIAGLQLAALSMRGRSDAAEFVDAFGGSHRFVVDYLVEEVIESQPDHLQQFMLKTSILGRLSGPLCEALTGQDNGQECLEKLDELNMFLIPLDDDRIWFRYHHLFADVMASRLQRLSPGQVPELYLRAAKWFQDNELFAEAVEHALIGDDFQLAAEIVESQAMTMLKAGNLTTLLGWLNKLPLNIVYEYPRLGIAFAWVNLLTGKIGDVEEYLETAESKLDVLDRFGDLRGEIAAIRTYSAALQGDADQAVNQAHKAFALLDKDNLAVRCVVTFVLGGVYYMRQDIPHALEAMKEASQLGEQAGNVHVAVSALSSMGDLHHRQGDLAAAEKVYYQAIQLGTGRSGEPLPIAASAYSGLAALGLTQKALISARRNALIGLELGEQWTNVDSQVSCLLTLAHIEHLQSHADQARDALEKAKRLAASHQLTPGFEEQIAATETAIFSSPPQVVDVANFDPLSDNELKVLRLIAAGLTNKEVAQEMYLSVNTVKWHLKQIYEKLDVHSRVAAVTRAQEIGLM